MRTADKTTLDYIIKHKEYFDQRLIDICHNTDKENKKVNDLNSSLQKNNLRYMQLNSNLKIKIKDLENQIRTINKQYQLIKKEHNKTLEYLKKMDDEIERQKEVIIKQEKIISEQKKIIDKLKHMNSSNSNLPSSMDILSHTKSKAQSNTREKTDLKRGGQVGHALHKSKIAKNPNRIINLKVQKAPTGAVAIKDNDGNIEYYVTQEVDLTLKSTIIETHYYIDNNGVILDKSDLSKYAINPFVYSDDFKAAVVYLNQKGTIPLQRLCDMMKEISKGSIQLKPSTIVNWCKECSDNSKKMRYDISKDILSAKVIHVDETGISVNGKKYWIHVITNNKGALYLMTQKRGDLEKGPCKLLETFSGILSHDHFSTYQKLLLCKHAECNAHIDRYLKSGVDFDGSSECKEMLELLHEILHKKHELIDKDEWKMSEDEMNNYENRYVEILERGLKEYQDKNPNIEKKYEAEYIKTFRRMLKYKDDHLRFMRDFEAPYTNNQAERQCRVVKAKKKTSGQFITEDGGEAYINILTLLQTAKIRKENALETLEKTFH